MQLKIEKSWHEKLKPELEKPYIQKIKDFLLSEATKRHTVYPSNHQIFRAFAYTPYDRVQVVILGQDPYHGPGQAEGLCFSVPDGVPPPPSLKNIYKELRDDLGCPIPKSPSLIPWAHQGVLLLNSTLTVRAGEPHSHHGVGWEQFTDHVISVLAERRDPIVFLLWGKAAQEKGSIVRGTHHIIYTAGHPSPYSAHLFLGCRHFSKTNQSLSRVGKSPIRWDH